MRKNRTTHTFDGGMREKNFFKNNFSTHTIKRNWILFSYLPFGQHSLIEGSLASLGAVSDETGLCRGQCDNDGH